ncbi:uncharacterized protein N7482_002567 [Penicillium canariense]|uniref:Ubiquitin interaction motif protein n=1 Tax=Penicillium canariense TaxID=189055 RepID=A0A9W9LUL1_9EURO|nr:uncharacterized protein N7482_002567 [Penicillium canariense]KAJ5176690.1 hypothetical protein N7482_002567 [Penicillium canariense]
MASEPSEDAIANFVSFTSTTRKQAISFLKANNLDSQKAINAYFEDPSGPQTETTGFYNESNVSSFGYGQQDAAPRMPATAPPSRPPSRVNMHEQGQAAGFDDTSATAPQGSAGPAPSGQGMSLAEREEQELQQAVAMSLNQGMGQQESGVTTAGNQEPHFGKATRDHYDEGAWAMTLFNATSQEVVISPDPEDRRRVDGEPAFIRPTNDNLYLGGFLTILHEIPLAREALLLRNRMLYDYGQEPQWWNGQPISLPKIVTVHDQQNGDNDWDDVLYETQRLMAFLDSTQRAFGSSDALAKLKDITSFSSDSEEVVTRFLETWQAAAVRADPDNPLTTAFMSHAYKRSPFDEGDDPISKELFIFEPVVEQEHGQTLYDLLDTAIWSDRPGEELDDVWLEHVGEVVIMKLDSYNNGKSVNVKAPSVFYPDRYLSSCRELARELRTKRLRVQEEIQELDTLMNPAAATTVALSKKPVEGADSPNSEMATNKADGIAKELMAVSARIEAKLKELDTRKQSAMETLRSYSKTLTEPPAAPGEPPLHRYTLRGVCTEPHITYVLKRGEYDDNSDDLMDIDGERGNGDQWWRISYSTEDGKTRQAAKREADGDSAATQNGDVIGYTARKVREIEVLRAAREEWRSVLLVYASDAAVNAKVDPAPTQLQDQGFVNKDNEAFAAECEQSAAHAGEGNGQVSVQQNNANKQQPALPRPAQQVNVFDYQVSDFDNDSACEQEMQERKGTTLLGTSNAANGAAISNALDDDTEWNTMEDTEMADHVEHSRAS